MDVWVDEGRKGRRRDKNTQPQTESSPQRLIKSLYWEAAGLVLSEASVWRLTLPLPIGQGRYFFHIPVSVSDLPVAWGKLGCLS